MLQVARLAPKQLGESRDLVAGFLRERLNPDGGFQDRAGASDLYYTVFGLDALIALAGRRCRSSGPPRYLDGFGDGAGLDFVHVACLARGWAALRRQPDAARRRSACSPASKRAAAATAAMRRRRARAHGSAYGAFLALGAYQDLGRALPDADGVLASLRRPARRRRQLRQSSRAAVRGHDRRPPPPCWCMRHLDAPPDRDAGMWLLDRCHPRGGFFASRADARSGSALDGDRAARAVGAARADRRPARAVPRFRRLALDQPRRLLRHLGRRRGRLRVHVLRAAGAGSSQPRPVVTALDRDRLDAALTHSLSRRLLDRRAAPDHWEGHLASSALSTGDRGARARHVGAQRLPGGRSA